jgi:hypothetical protein
MTAKALLAEFVMDHLGDNDDKTIALATACTGIAHIASAYDDAQNRRGNWGVMLGNLRSGIQALEQTLPALRRDGGPGVAAVIELGQRELAFARDLQAEIERLQAGESTLV